MKINKASAASFAIFGALVASCAIAQDKMDKMDKMDHKGGKMAMSGDSHFAMEAASGGLTEVALGKMATEKGSNQAVKDFGQKMVDDHTKANDELKSLAASKNMMLPSEPNAKDKATIDKMSAMSGAAFDKAYVRDMVMDHKKDIALFTKEANSGTDSDVKAFASKTLPTLQEHQKMITDIAAKKM